jgi:lipid-A-disaccharide synthase
VSLEVEPSAADRSSGPLIALVAGEPSGDSLGARLMRALRRQTSGKVRFVGVGGPQMASEGLNSIFPIEDISVIGIIEVIPHIPVVLRRIRQTVRAIEAARPQVIVTIDSPTFSFQVARRLKCAGIPLVHYVAPSVWAWKAWRAKHMAAYYDQVLALLPFEPPYFEAVGLPCSFVGHPAVEDVAEQPDAGLPFRHRHDIPEGAPLLCLCPGSRRSEVVRLLPVFGETLQILCQRHPDLRIVVPAVDAVAGEIAKAAEGWSTPVTLLRGVEEKTAAFEASDVALAASGTVVLELAVAGVPTVVSYRVSAVTAFIARRLLKVKYVNLINLVLDRGLVPELLQEECRPDRLAQEVLRLLDDQQAREAQIEGGKEVARRLGTGEVLPSERAASIVLKLLG